MLGAALPPAAAGGADAVPLQFRSCMLKLLFCGRSPFGDDEDVSGSSQATQVSSVSSSHVAPA